MQINESLIKKIKKGDRKVILELYNHTFNVLMSTAVRYKANQEDQMTIVNNAFMKILDKLDQFRLGTAFLSWCKRIVINVAIDDFRKNKKYKTLFEFEVQDELLHIENEEFENNVGADQLLELINQLPPATKIVFNLFAIDGLTNNQIAQELDISYETVKWHIKSARKDLRAKINKIGAKETA